MSIPSNEKQRCYNCKFYYRQDHGYSNYTVEDTEVNCLRGKNPNIEGVSEGYSWETDDHEFMKVAEACDSFARGEPLYIDVDEESIPYLASKDRNKASYYTDDAEVIAAFSEFEARP